MSVSTKQIFTGIAPGRLDVMGGIADYSGSLVLQMPIREQTKVEVTLREDFICRVVSTTRDGDQHETAVDYRSLLQNQSVDFDFAKNEFKKDPENSWVAYIIGCALMLQKQKKIDFRGADFKINSGVPLGKGVSSSASLEVATMKALAEAFHLSFSNTELPVLAQQVENRIVGAPCGLMDQLATYFGKQNQLLPIVCQPDLVQAPIPIPENISFIGIDSGVRHSVGGASYGDVRCAAFMGYSIILQSLGISVADIRKAGSSNNYGSLPFSGYLCNISVKEFEQQFHDRLPVSIKGKDFLRDFQITTDTVTTVNPETNYAVRQCTSHPVYENARVHRFQQLLKQITSGDQGPALIQELGHLMYEAHESYSRCRLGSERTDEIVALAKANVSKGIAGAKITGGGSGGTVCLLAVGNEGKETARNIHKELCQKYKSDLALFE